MTDQDAPQTAAAATAAPQPGPGVVSSIRRYAAAEGGARAVLQPAGAAGVRITLVGDGDGHLGDRVVPSSAVAQEVVDRIDDVQVAAEWDRELTTKATVSPAHWRRMAGWVAHQKRFPKARNRRIVDYR